MDAEESTEKSTISEGKTLKKLGITNFKSLFRKTKLCLGFIISIPSTFGYRVWNLTPSEPKVKLGSNSEIERVTSTISPRTLFAMISPLLTIGLE